MLALQLCNFSGDLYQYCSEALYFCGFSGGGGGGGGPDPLSAHGLIMEYKCYLHYVSAMF